MPRVAFDSHSDRPRDSAATLNVAARFAVSPFMSMLQEFRYGMRLLGRHKGFAAVGVFTLALGIGANTAMFSIVNGVLLNPFPYPAPDSLMFVTSWSQQFNTSVPLTYPDYLDFRHGSRVFRQLAAARAT